jgi:hypothetical protein
VLPDASSERTTVRFREGDRFLNRMSAPVPISPPQQQPPWNAFVNPTSRKGREKWGTPITIDSVGCTGGVVSRGRRYLAGDSPAATRALSRCGRGKRLDGPEFLRIFLLDLMNRKGIL